MAKINLILSFILIVLAVTMWRTRPSYYEDTLQVSTVMLPTPKFVKLKPSELQRLHRLLNAQELLGKYYRSSVVRQGERVNKVNSLVYELVRERLPAKHKKHFELVAQTIIDESLRNEFDPVLLISIILGESNFNPDCRGPVDEIGLMQLRPATGKWIARLYGMKWEGEKTLRDPVSNIKLGAFYLNHLRAQFRWHARLYLAAYNMGARNVDEARAKKIWPKDYPIHVMKRYVDIYASLNLDPEVKGSR